MTHPNLKALALAAVEADAAMKKENHLTTKYALLKESHDALGAFHSVATPERILEAAARIETLEEALKPIAELFADAQGRLTPDYGEITGRDFQMMTMHPDPEGLASDLRRAARTLTDEKEPK